jgi:hypothetical protein
MRERIREWLDTDLIAARWVLLGLYLLALIGLSVPYFTPGLIEGFISWAVLLVLFFIAYALFMGGGGTTRLCATMPYRLWMPVAVTSALIVLLLLGASAVLGELFPAHFDAFGPGGILLALIGGWLVGGVLLALSLRRWPRFTAMGLLAGILFVAGLVQLAATVPAYISICTRPAPQGSQFMALSVVCHGIFVLVFALGILLTLLFLRPRYLRELRERDSLCPACGYDLRGSLAAGGRVCPECGAQVPDNAVTLPLT